MNKIEIGENLKLVILLSLSAIAMLAAVAIVRHFDLEHDKAAIAAGLERGPVPGSTGVHWVRPKH